MDNQTIRRSLRLLKIEAIITSVVFAMPILNIFYAEEIGLSLAEVGLTQAAFTIAVFLFNIPTGWLADRFSRKACNVFGDLLAAGGFVFYAFAQSFTDIVIAEIVVGIGLAFTGGADVALLKAYAGKLGESYQKLSAQLASWRPIAEMAAVSLGGIVGAYSPRLAIALSAVTYGTGAVLSLFIVEAGEHRKSGVHPVKDMARITRFALHGHKQLAWRIAAYALGREATHPIIWILTPLLLLAGIPPAAIGVAWAINLALVWVGAQLARRYGGGLSDSRVLAIGVVVFAVSSAVLMVDVNLVTIVFYAGFGFVRGWYGAQLLPAVQHHTPADIQSTVVSVAASAAQLIYIPLVWGVGALGDISPQASIAGVFCLFVPLLALTAHKIARFEAR